MVWRKLDDMSQVNNEEIEAEALPPLVMEMRLQQKYILAGILKVKLYGVILHHQYSPTPQLQILGLLMFSLFIARQ